jgi:adenine-specific DNA-methyltransferase
MGIAEYITKPRIRVAITGETPEGEPINGNYTFTDEFPMAEGFEENVEFFDLTYEDSERVRHDLAFSAIAPLLWMRAGSVGRRIDTPNNTFDIASRDGLRIAYIVTDDEAQYQSIAAELPHRVEAVRLYESYLRTFEINTGEA